MDKRFRDLRARAESSAEYQPQFRVHRNSMSTFDDVSRRSIRDAAGSGSASAKPSKRGPGHARASSYDQMSRASWQAKAAALVAETVSEEAEAEAARDLAEQQAQRASRLSKLAHGKSKSMNFGHVEDEATLDALAPGSCMVGFYSYGEIAPHADGACDLHNQTMTLTTIAEA